MHLKIILLYVHCDNWMFGNKFNTTWSFIPHSTQKVSWAANRAVYFEDIYCSDWTILSHKGITLLSVTSRKRSTLLWRHLLQCHTCILTSFSTLSQLSNICTISPFSNVTVSCVYLMAEPKKCHEPQKEHSTLKTSTAVTDLSPNIFLNTFSTVSCL